MRNIYLYQHERRIALLLFLSVVACLALAVLGFTL